MAMTVCVRAGLRRERCGRSEAARRRHRAADFARLQREVAEQRQLIIQMMQVEQQRYDMLLQAAAARRAGCRRRGACRRAVMPPPAPRRPRRRRDRRQRPSPAARRRKTSGDAPRRRSTGRVAAAQRRRSRTPTSTSTGAGARGARPHARDQAEGQAVLAAGRGGPTGTQRGVPQPGHRLSQRVLDVAGKQQLRPRQLPRPATSRARSC